MDLTAIKAVESAPVKRQSTTRESGPNPWLNKAWEQGLWASYEAGVPFSAEFPGKREMLPAKRGEIKGQPIEKVTGDAGQAEFLIRKAARLLSIGAAVRVEEELTTYDAKGKPTVRKAKPGHLWVTWQGQTMKQRKQKTTETLAS